MVVCERATSDGQRPITTHASVPFGGFGAEWWGDDRETLVDGEAGRVTMDGEECAPVAIRISVPSRDWKPQETATQCTSTSSELDNLTLGDGDYYHRAGHPDTSVQAMSPSWGLSGGGLWANYSLITAIPGCALLLEPTHC